MANITKWTATGAFVTHDHKGGRTLAKALTDVRAGGLFTNCVEIVLAQDPLDVIKARASRGCLDTNPVGFFKTLGRHNLDRDTRVLASDFCLALGSYVGAVVGAVDMVNPVGEFPQCARERKKETLIFVFILLAVQHA